MKNKDEPKNFKWTKRAAKTAFVLGFFYWLMSPSDMEFDEDNDYEPNDVQAEFLRLAAKEFNYVALGDTDHRKAVINKFALNPETVRALADGGTENFFLEMGPGWQPYIDQAAGKSSDPRTFSREYGDLNMWLCDEDVRQALTDNFEKTVSTNKDVNFIAADMRHSDQSDYDDFYENNKWTMVLPMAIYQGIYGCMAPQAFIIPTITLAATGQLDEFDNSLANDNQTADKVMSHEGEGALFYGAAHFTYDVTSRQERERSMKTLLEQDGKSFALLNVFQDESQDELPGANRSSPDAILYVNESAGNPDGILALTPKMKELERRAHENVKRARALTQ